MARKLTIVSRLSALALRPLLGDGADNLVNSVFSHIADHGSKVSIALEQAQNRAWRSLEVALAGDSWWGRCKSVLTAGDERAFRRQVQQFLAAVPLQGLPAPEADFRRDCLQELRDARKRGLLPGDRLPPDELPEHAATMIKYTDPQSLLNAEWESVRLIAADLDASGYKRLARFVEFRPTDGLPLLVVATRFFFRREVEYDAELSRGLTYQQLDRITHELETGFNDLNETLTQHGQRLEELLGDVKEIVEETRADVREVRDIVQDSREDVASLRAEIEAQGRQMRELFGALQQALAQAQSAPPLPVPAAAAEPTRQQVQELLDQCNSLPAEQLQQAKSVVRLTRRLESAAQTYDANRRAFPFLSEPAPTRSTEQHELVTENSAPSTGSPRKQVRGALINEALFGSASPPADESAPPPTPPKKPGGRIVSKLLQPKTESEEKST